MTTLEFENMGIWLIRFVVYGTLIAIAFGFLVVTLKSFRANLRSRGIIGILIGVIKLIIFAGLILILIHLADEYHWVDSFEDFLNSHV